MGLELGPDILGHRLVLEGTPAFVQGAGQARQSLVSMRQESTAAGQAVGEMGATWHKVGQLAVAAGGIVAGISLVKHSLSEAVSNAQAMNKLGAVVGSTKEAYSKFGEGIDSLARRVGVADDKIAEVTAQALQMGVSESNALGLVESSAKVARLSQEDLASVLGATTNVMNTYRLSADQTSRVQSALFEGWRRSGVSVGELGDFIGLRGSSVKQLGLGYQELVAIIGTLGQSGIRGQRAIGSLQMVLQGLLEPGDTARQTAQRLGIEWDASAIRAMGFAKWLDHVQQRLKTMAGLGNDTAKSLKELGVGGMAANAFTALTENAGKFSDMLREIEGNAGAVDTMFGKRMRDPLGKKDQFETSVSQLYESFGTGILQGLTGVNGTAPEELAKMRAPLEELGKALGTNLASLANAIVNFIPPLTSALQGIADVDKSARDTTGVGVPEMMLGAWGASKLYGAGKTAAGWWTRLMGNKAVAPAIEAAAGSGGGSALAEGVGTLAEGLETTWASSRYIELETALKNPSTWAKLRAGAIRGGGTAIRGGLKALPIIGQIAMMLDSTELPGVAGAVNAETGLPDSRSEIKPSIGRSGNSYSMWIAKQLGESLDQFGVSLEERLVGQSVPDMQNVVEEAFREFAYGLFSQGLGMRLAAITGELAANASSREEDAKKLPITMEVNTNLSWDFGDSDEAKKFSSRTRQTGGAGAARVNQDYRFMVYTEGDGIRAVKPMAENVVLGHLRPVVKG